MSVTVLLAAVAGRAFITGSELHVYSGTDDVITSHGGTDDVITSHGGTDDVITSQSSLHSGTDDVITSQWHR